MLPVANGYFRDLGDELVTIYAGPSKRKFTVHKKLICDKVTVFAKMFDGLFKEGISGTAELPEDDEDSVGCFLEWLYRDDCGLFVGEIHHAFLDEPPIIVSTAQMNLYIFASKYSITPLMERVTDSIRKFHADKNIRPNPLAMLQVYDNTPENCGLRRYMLQCLRWVVLNYRDEGSWTSKEILEAIYKNKDLSRDLIVALRPSDSKKVDPVSQHNCDFHEHPREEVCQLTPCPKSTALKKKRKA